VITGYNPEDPNGVRAKLCTRPRCPFLKEEGSDLCRRHEAMRAIENPTRGQVNGSQDRCSKDDCRAALGIKDGFCPHHHPQISRGLGAPMKKLPFAIKRDLQRALKRIARALDRYAQRNGEPSAAEATGYLLGLKGAIEGLDDRHQDGRKVRRKTPPPEPK
jgi:hypothetical protein